METTRDAALEDVDVVLRDGSTVRVRAALRGCRDPLERFLGGLSRPAEGSRPRPSPTPARTDPDAAG